MAPDGLPGKSTWPRNFFRDNEVGGRYGGFMNGAAVAPWTEEIMMRMWRQASSQYRNEQARQRREAKRSEDAARARVAGMSFHWTNESGEGVCDGAHEWFDLCAEALASVAGMQVGDRRVLPGSATIVRVA